jgi:hypothetical protein
VRFIIFSAHYIKMGGGLLQLVAYGAQDVYLSGNPQITFFKVAYRRHTNFSMESIEQTFNGTADFGRRVTCQISRNGDLIHRMYLQVALENASWLKGSYAGLALIKSVELEIGGQRIDKQYGDWMYIWNELSLPAGKRAGFDAMVGADDRIFKATADDTTDPSLVTAAAAADAVVVTATATLETAEADLETAEQELAAATTDRDNAQIDVNSATIAYNEDSSQDNQDALDQANNALTAAQTAFDAATATVTSKTAARDTAQTALNNAITAATDATAAVNAADASIIDYAGAVAAAAATMTDTRTTLFIPLEFWFCRNPGLALPLIALQYHEVKVNLEFDTLANTGIKPITFLVSPHSQDSDAPSKVLIPTNSVTPTIGTASLWVDYIFLDTDERRRFAQLSHEYLIEQLQYTGEESVSAGSNKIKLNFNHPVKELVWVMQEPNASFGCFDTSGNVGANVVAPTTTTSVDADSAYMIAFARTGANLTKDAKLQLNGHDRFALRSGKYFNLVQPFQHHANISSNAGINVYSFALKPEEHQPSGTLNFSRIDSAVLNVTATSEAAKIRVYAVNYNVLRIMSGMGGLSYSN